MMTPMIFAPVFLRIALRTRPLFRSHIATIVPHRSQKQMVGTDTWWIIAAVADNEARRDWAICQLPGQSVCANILAVRSLSDRLQSIAKGITTTSPQPTGICLMHLCPEPGRKRPWRNASLSSAVLRAKPLLWSRRLIRDVAVLTGAWRDRLIAHREFTPSGVTLRAVAAAPEPFHAFIVSNGGALCR
jgi:hypothetical protein